jgi:hypothetical protein
MHHQGRHSAWGIRTFLQNAARLDSKIV